MARIQRQELKHDEFIDSVDQLRVYLEEHGRRLALIALLAVLIAVLVGGYLWTRRTQERAASALLNEAVATFEAPVQEGLPSLPGGKAFSSQDEKLKAAAESFASIHDQFPRTLAGKVARHYEGVCKFLLGEHEAGLAILEEVARGGDREVTSLARLHLAGFYAEVGRTAEAEQIYRELMSKPTVTVPEGVPQMELAALLTNSKPAEARRLYEQVKVDYPNTPVADMATQRLELLPATGTAEPAPESGPEGPPSN